MVETGRAVVGEKASMEAAADRRGVWRAVAVLLGVVALVHHPLFAGRSIYHRDVIRWLLPARAFLRAALLEGRLPVWNAHVGLGFPTPSDPLYGPFYPPTLLTLAGPLVPMTMAWMLAHLCFGGLGCMLLARRFGASAVGALVAGLGWSLSGYVAAQWSTGILMPAGAWVPWSALGWMTLARGVARPGPGWWRHAAWGALSGGAVFLCGEVFLAMIITGFGLLMGAASLRWPPPPVADATAPPAASDGGPWRRFGVAALLALALTPLCGAATLVPALRVASTTERAAPLARAFAERLSLHPARLAELVAPGSLGRAFDASPGADIDHYFSHGILSFSVYLGAALVGLALVALSRRRDVIFLAAFAALGVLVSLGGATPVHAALRVLVPPLAYMRSPEKYLALVVPLVAVLAALGADRLLREARLTWRLGVVPLATGALWLGAGRLYLPTVAPFVSDGAWRGLVASLGLVAVALLARRWPRAAAASLVALVACDLGLHVHGFHVYTSRPALTATPPLAEFVRRDGGSAPAPPRVFRSDRVDQHLVGRVEPRGRLFMALTLTPNTSVSHGVAILPGYDIATPPSLRRVLGTGRSDALRLLSVDHALLSAAPGTPEDAPRPGFAPRGSLFPGVRLYRVLDPLPRVYLAGSVAPTPSAEPEQRALQADVLAGRVALVDAPDALPAVSSAPGSRGDCVLEAWAPGALRARCTADGPRLAVFVEQFAQGWTAEIDGRPASVVRANLIACGVVVPAGTHRIALRYVAPGLTAGLLLSALGWVGVLASLRLRRRRAARRAGDASSQGGAV